jgi:3',5'-cyclic AMP phosphodiesterase CpdA
MLIAQISDLHIRPDGLLYADRVPSNAMAHAAIQHLNKLDPRPDLVLITGDIVDDGSDAAYQVSRRILAGLEIPYLVIPGNHDRRGAFVKAFADCSYLPRHGGPLNYVFDAGEVRIVALDSTVPTRHHGDIDAAGLSWLEQALADGGARPTLVLMHHQPFPCGIPYLEKYRHFGAEKIADVIGKFPSVERLLCGHVHRFMTARVGGALAMSCPSTASQIALRLSETAEPASFMEPPGCLLHLWQPGFGFISHLSPIGDYGAAMDFF